MCVIKPVRDLSQHLCLASERVVEARRVNQSDVVISVREFVGKDVGSAYLVS